MKFIHFAFLSLFSIMILIGIAHVGIVVLAVTSALFTWIALTPEVHERIKSEEIKFSKSYFYSLFFAYMILVLVIYQATIHFGGGVVSGLLVFSAELAILKTSLISIYLHPETSNEAARRLFLFSRICELVFVCMLPLFYWDKERFLGWISSQFGALEKDGVNRSAVAGAFFLFFLIISLFFYYFGVDQESYKYRAGTYRSYGVVLISALLIFMFASMSSFAFKKFKIS